MEAAQFSFDGMEFIERKDRRGSDGLIEWEFGPFLIRSDKDLLYYSIWDELILPSMMVGDDYDVRKLIFYREFAYGDGVCGASLQSTFSSSS